jgi:uncharacterized RDD family membrane protein YckC
MNTPNPYAPPRSDVRDVADPTARADRGTRLVAAILDGIIMMAMVYLPLMVGGGAGAIVAAASGKFDPRAFFGIGAVLALVGLVAWIWLTVVFVKRNGQTIAKKMLGIKVVRADGSPISLARIFWLRNFVNSLLGIVPFYGLVDALVIFGEPRQCLHDKIADTIVIKA